MAFLVTPPNKPFRDQNSHVTSFRRVNSKSKAEIPMQGVLVPEPELLCLSETLVSVGSMNIHLGDARENAQNGQSRDTGVLRRFLTGLQFVSSTMCTL